MALITEDGTGKSDAESYLSLTAAGTYHTANNNAAWTGADAVKEAALRKATRYLDGRYGSHWPGTKKTSIQALLWPRSDGYDVAGYAIASDVVPKPVQDATAELALRALTASLAPDRERGDLVKRVKVGPIEEEHADHAPGGVTYPEVDLILEPILARGGVMVRG